MVKLFLGGWVGEEGWSDGEQLTRVVKERSKSGQKRQIVVKLRAWASAASGFLPRQSSVAFDYLTE